MKIAIVLRKSCRHQLLSNLLLTLRKFLN